MLSTQFLLTSLVVVLIPGTGALYTISTGVSNGRRAGIAAAMGCTLGIVPHLTASALGLSAIMNMSAQLFSIARLAGAAYLLYLAWRMWRDTGAMELGSEDDTLLRWRQVSWRGVVLNLLNPKLTIFFLAFLPQFIDKEASAAPQLLGLSGVFMLMTFVVFACYALIAGTMRSLLSGERATMWIKRSFALAFTGLAIDLALGDR